MDSLDEYLQNSFNIDRNILLDALKNSPSAQGYIHGAVGEEIFKIYAEKNSFKVFRIKEKPEGGFRAKTVYGDFYIRKDDYEEDKAIVVECKGLKTNVEFFRNGWTSKEKVIKKLKDYCFPPIDAKEKTYNKGKKTYDKTKIKWETKNPGKTFPPFRWNREHPGSDNTDLSDIWENEDNLKNWINSQSDELFKRKSYETLEGIVKVLMTHKPSQRIAPISGIKQATPLVSDFDILSVDLFLRTGKHELVFMNPKTISHSPSSPEHLYQNYIIDILIKNKKEEPKIHHPWYRDLQECIDQTNPVPKKIDDSQLDNR